LLAKIDFCCCFGMVLGQTIKKKGFKFSDPLTFLFGGDICPYTTRSALWACIIHSVWCSVCPQQDNKSFVHFSATKPYNIASVICGLSVQYISPTLISCMYIRCLVVVCITLHYRMYYIRSSSRQPFFVLLTLCQSSV